MTTRTVTSHILNLHGAARAGDTVSFRLLDGTYTATEHVPEDTQTATIDASGNISIVLYCPANYDCTIAEAMRFQFTLPDSAVATTLEALHASAAAAPTATNALQTLIDAHAAQANPHAVYLTQPEGDALYASVLGGHAHTFASLTGPPTTLAGYGIADAYTAGQADTLLAAKQPLDSDLTAIAALTTTAYGRALLALADAAAARTALGAAGTADLTAHETDTTAVHGIADTSKVPILGTQTLTDGASIAWNVAGGAFASVTLGGNRTLANPTNLIAGASYVLKVTQDGTGTRTLAYGNAYKWAGGTAPVLSTAIGAVDILTFLTDGTSMFGAVTKAFA